MNDCAETVRAEVLNLAATNGSSRPQNGSTPVVGTQRYRMALHLRTRYDR